MALAARHAIPVIYDNISPTAGQLIRYGPDSAEIEHELGVYLGRVLKGEWPADLPVVQPTKFELVIDLKAAETLGLTVPLTLRVSATQIIE